MTDALEQSPPQSAVPRWYECCYPFRRGAALPWPAAWLISLVMVFVPLTTWWFVRHPYSWSSGFQMTVLTWIYFGSPLLPAALWKSGKVFTTALVMVWATLLLDVAWLAVQMEFRDFRWV